jgi:hypothetical protein
VARWILVIKYISPVVLADSSDFASEQIQREFIQIMLILASQYSSFFTKDETSPFALRCAEVQLRFLMSSDLYERKGLLNTLLDVLEEDLAIPAPGSDANSQSAKSDGDVNAWRCCNSVMIVARIPLEPIPRDHKNTIFEKLMELDKYLVRMSGKMNGNLEILIVVRRALIRFVGVVGKTTVEV